MKILSATVTDPRRGGEYRNPFLTVEVDEDVAETGPAVAYGAINADWVVTPHGPFVAVDWTTLDSGGNKYIVGADLGTFNVTDNWRDKLVEVQVNSPDEEVDLALSLDRARRLLRKHNLSWRFIMDDVAGQHGKVQWRLIREPLACMKCGRIGPTISEAYFKGTHLAYCSDHLAEHNRMIRNIRVRSA